MRADGAGPADNRGGDRGGRARRSRRLAHHRALAPVAPTYSDRLPDRPRPRRDDHHVALACGTAEGGGMIVILGATGATGSALLARLAALEVPCRALSRNPARLRVIFDEMSCPHIEVRRADATDPATLRTAFAGGTQLFLTMTNS